MGPAPADQDRRRTGRDGLGPLGERPWCTGIHFTLADVAVGCALAYLDFRFPNIGWREQYPNLVAFQEKIEKRQSFIDTALPSAG